MNPNKDGIGSLYHPHIAAQIPEGATKVNDVPDKMMPVDADPQPAQAQVMDSAVVTDFSNFTVPLYMPGYLTGFMLDIDRMNSMYRMPVVDQRYTADIKTRLDQFKSILAEECKEIDDIVGTVETPEGFDPSAVLVQLADLLGDIIVYCASEAKRWGIPIDEVLNIIMQSNFSKLDENDQPIYDERMKLQKGPNYWKPEPKIAEMLAAKSTGVQA